jgi:hydrogenase expression/formation protein HypD
MGSLYQAKAKGGDVRVIYSGFDALRVAEENRDREVVFFSVGFETTAAPTASLFRTRLPQNLSILTSHKLTSPAVEMLMEVKGEKLDGIVAPGHVSTIVGAQDWERFPKKYGVTTVVAGFEPIDLLLAVLRIIEQIKRGEPKLINEYSRLVKYEGNMRARKEMDRVFYVSDTWWRGIGSVPNSGLFLRNEFKEFDARERFGLEVDFDPEEDTPPGCICHLIILGRSYPSQCPLFGKKCTPLDPYGPCMVSQEGTCYIWYRYGSREQISKFRKGGQ